MKYKVTFYLKEVGAEKGTVRDFGENSIFDLAAVCFNAGRSEYFDSMEVVKMCTDEYGEEVVLKKYKWEKDRSLAADFMKRPRRFGNKDDIIFKEDVLNLLRMWKGSKKDPLINNLIRMVSVLPKAEIKEKTKPKYMTEEGYKEWREEMND